MNPDGNRHQELYNASSRAPDPRYGPGYPGMPQGAIPNLSNYMLPMNQIFYPPYMYHGFPFPNGPYFGSVNPFRDSLSSHPNFAHEINSLRSYYNPQNMRVIPRELREKTQNQVINLQSDEQEPKQKNVLMPPSNYTKKTSQKQAQIINLDQNSQEKNQKVEEPPIVQKKESTYKTSKIQAAVEKIQATMAAEPKIKQKQLSAQIKTKQICKIRNKPPKIIQKQQKPSKQRKKKSYQQQKIIPKVEKQKQLQKIERVEKIQKRKNQKIQKPQKNDKTEKNERNERNDKNEKNRKVPATQQKNKHYEQIHTREIAKYMESHGQIRHGKQFQSDIPSVKITGNLDFNKWLQDKRKSILKREVGVLTY